ncbi:hypothetical protein ACFVVU_27130 [Kitasatospora sp. NPDC057965]|uniref:hypothetical protein n=1 Tax=Kitasatospora sp. NPDC057965 TaxID=3346291 RepID=UPI0036DEBA18
MTASLTPRRDDPGPTAWRLRIWGRLICAGLAVGGGWGAVITVLGYSFVLIPIGAVLGAAVTTSIAILTAMLLAWLPDRAALSSWSAPLTGAALACAAQFYIIGIVIDEPQAFLDPRIAAITATTAALVAAGFLWAVRGARR